MTIEELKAQIQERVGVPAALIKGETPEEVVAQARALIAYRNKSEADRPKDTGEQFAAWFDARSGIEHQDAAGTALAEIEESLRAYPVVNDGSQDDKQFPDPRPASEQFVDWFRQTTAFDPTKGPDGWKRIN